MATEVIPFSFDGNAVRVIMRNGEPWWVLADVCKVLEISNPRDAASRLDDDEKDGVGITDAIGREQQTTVINESGLYSVILTSRKEAAKRFKKWVTADVVPTIRKTGSYGLAAPQMSPAELMARALLAANDTLNEQRALISEMQPKVEALDRIASADGSFCFRDAAKMLQVSETRLMELLQLKGWVYRRPGKDCRWVAYGVQITAGLLLHKISPYERRDGTIASSTQARVTPKGLAEIGKWLADRRGPPPQPPKQGDLPLH
jgi:anti-repressor protein